MKKDKHLDKMMSDEDKIIKDIDANGNGRISKKELKTFLKDKAVVDKVEVGIDIGVSDDDYTCLVCPVSGNHYTVKAHKLEEFYDIFGADDSWRV